MVKEKRARYLKVLDNYNFTEEQRKAVDSLFSQSFKIINSFEMITSEDDISITIIIFDKIKIYFNKKIKTILVESLELKTSSTRYIPFFNKHTWDTMYHELRTSITQKINVNKLIKKERSEELDFLSDEQSNFIAKYISNIVKMRAMKYVKVMRGIIFKTMIDKEAFKMSCKFTGRDSSLLYYNYVVSNIEEIRKLEKITPSIIAMWLAWKNSEIHLSDKFCCFYAYNIVKEVQDLLIVSFSKKYWKLFCKMSITCAYSFAKKVFPQGNTNEDSNSFMWNRTFLNTMIESKSIPRPHVFKHLLLNYTDYLFPEDKLSVFLRAVFIESNKRRRGLKLFWNNEVSLVKDWVSAINYVDYTEAQYKSPWSWWMRKQEEWHEAIRLNPKLRVGFTEWDTLVTEFKHESYIIKPLNNSHLLYDEGKIMHHCVGGYSNQCVLGRSRIFSIQDNCGKRLATLEIRLRGGAGSYAHGDIDKSNNFYYDIAQCRGPYNQNVSEEITSISKLIASLYTKEYKKINKEKEPVLSSLNNPFEDDDFMDG
jgi:hypothetical protein